MTGAARRLLDHLVDYAGLFPPAALAMPEAVARFAAAREGRDAWMLARFVVPAGRLSELAAARARAAAGAGSDWELSVLIGEEAGGDVRRVTAAAGECLAAGLRVASVEVRAGTAAEVERLAGALPAGVEWWFEASPGASLGSTLGAIAAAGGGAKIRLGGVTPAAFPTSRDVAGAVLACARAGVRFKATAGLHHAVRGRFRVTYADDSPQATMHGFLNLFLASALARALARERHPEPEAETMVAALLDESDPGAFHWDDEAVRWRSRVFDAASIADMRAAFARSFGSCSFDEPVADLRRLGLLEAARS